MNEVASENLINALKKLKLKDSLYYTTDSLMGIDWWHYAWLIGARGRGKSYASVETVLRHYKKYGYDSVKCYYFRISDLSVQAMLENKGAKAIDASLVRKYNLEITRKGNTLYNHGHPIMEFYALVSAAKKGKGLAMYDPDFLNNRPIDPLTGKPKKRFIFIIIDEFMMAEGIEKKSVGNPVEQFKIYMENILRDQLVLDYPAVRILGCANAVSECSDFLAQLAGFIPEQPGRYALKRKHMIVDNIPNTDAYIEKRLQSYNADIMDYGNDANYTNVIRRDIETLIPKSYRLKKPTAIIMFDKYEEHWFTIWDGNIISRYTNQKNCKNRIAMKRYLDNNFDADLVASIFLRYDSRNFKYTDMISLATFAAQLKLLKAR